MITIVASTGAIVLAGISGRCFELRRWVLGSAVFAASAALIQAIS